MAKLHSERLSQASCPRICCKPETVAESASDWSFESSESTPSVCTFILVLNANQTILRASQETGSKDEQESFVSVERGEMMSQHNRDCLSLAYLISGRRGESLGLHPRLADNAFDGLDETGDGQHADTIGEVGGGPLTPVVT